MVCLLKPLLMARQYIENRDLQDEGFYYENIYIYMKKIKIFTEKYLHLVLSGFRIKNRKKVIPMNIKITKAEKLKEKPK